MPPAVHVHRPGRGLGGAGRGAGGQPRRRDLFPLTERQPEPQEPRRAAAGTGSFHLRGTLLFNEEGERLFL